MENYDEYRADDEQRTNYGKKGAHLMNARESKVESEGKGEAMRAGGESGQNNGPTGSRRDYGKKGREMHGEPKTDWNPIKKTASTYGICGV